MVPQEKRRLGTALVALALVVAAIPATLRSYRPTAAPRFDLPQSRRESAEASFFAGEYLPAIKGMFVHSATLAQVANGDLIAAWYGGSDEAVTDVRLFISRCDHATGKWTPPQVLETREHVEKSLGLHVKSIGNPVLYADEHGVSLFFVSILFGGWSGGTICMKTSADGAQWSAPRGVYTSPFLNVGMLVRARPWRYTDGTIALPIYHQLIRKWSAMARLDENGSVIDIARIADSRPLIQPWIVPVDASHAVAFLRWSSALPGCVTMTRSDDSGVHWSEISSTRLVHRDSGVSAIRLADGSLLAAYNNSAWDRRDLSIARTADGGIHWSRPHPVERDTAPDEIVRREYSYPFLLQTRDGRYHMLYTWQRTRIRHIVFNDSWVLSDPLLGRPGA
jgi:predicted neuraminidase